MDIQSKSASPACATKELDFFTQPWVLVKSGKENSAALKITLTIVSIIVTLGLSLIFIAAKAIDQHLYSLANRIKKRNFKVQVDTSKWVPKVDQGAGVSPRSIINPLGDLPRDLRVARPNAWFFNRTINTVFAYLGGEDNIHLQLKLKEVRESQYVDKAYDGFLKTLGSIKGVALSLINLASRFDNYLIGSQSSTRTALDSISKYNKKLVVVCSDECDLDRMKIHFKGFFDQVRHLIYLSSSKAKVRDRDLKTYFPNCTRIEIQPTI